MFYLKKNTIRLICCMVLLCFLVTTLLRTELVYGEEYDNTSDISFVEDTSSTGLDTNRINEDDTGARSDANLESGADTCMKSDMNLLNASDFATESEDDLSFEDGGPYLWLQYDQTYFNLILTKNKQTLYDSTDGISEEESNLIQAHTPVELGLYDYVLQFKEDTSYIKEGSFELKGADWKDYWDYQVNTSSWKRSVVMVNFSVVVLKNHSGTSAYMSLTNTSNDKIFTPDYQIMDDTSKGIKYCVYYGDVLFNEGDYYADGEIQYPSTACTWVATPIDTNYAEKRGNFTWGSNTYNGGPTNFTKRMYNQTAYFQVPKGAQLRVFLSGEAHYMEYKVFTPSTIDESNADYDTYTYKKLCTGKLNYLIGGWVNGVDTGFLKKVGEARLSGGKPTYTIAASDMEQRDNSKRVDSGYKEDNIYQNTDDSKFVQLKNGENFDFEAFRVWQSVGSITGNNFVEPDYHYEVIGDSVTLGAIGSLGREKMRITGAKQGVSVIKVTYDALGNFAGGDSGKYANAIAPINTGLIIVDVDGNNDANIKANIQQIEYDTIYYTNSINGTEQEKQYAEYTFKPTADKEISVRVHDPLHNTTWGEGWTFYEPNADGNYTAHLKEGRNIIEIRAGDSVQYYVVNAKGVQINIENETNPGQPLKVGDTVKINFKDLSQPIQKMAGIYNPGFPGTCWIQYETEKGRVVKSEGVQYDVILKNDMEFVLTQPGSMKLINGQMHSGHLGSDLGTHRKIPAAGMLPNLNASSGANSPYFSTLPIISFNVDDDQAEQELSKLTYAQLYTLKAAVQTVENSWTLVSSTWADLNSKRNMAKDWKGGDGALTILPITVNNDMKITARYFLQGDPDDTFTEVSDLVSGSEKQIINLLKRGEIAYVEITVTPKDESKGYTQTYTLRAANYVSTNYPYLTNLKLSAVNGQSDMETLDGQLQAVTENNLELGYGFLTTRKNFTTHVPYSVDKITLTATQGKADAMTINGSDASDNTPTAEIELQVGNNEIPVVCSSGGKEITYIISVMRDTEPKKIEFELENGAQMLLKKASGKTVEMENDGRYMLSEGTYTYYYSKTGYLTKSGEVEIKGDTTVVTLPALTKAEQTFGDVSVRAMAQDRILRDKTTISFTEDTLSDTTEDMEVQGYVAHNYGGYTALHALIDAFNMGISKVSFSCYKGVLTPKVDIDTTNQGSNAGWVCEVNGKECNPATTLVNAGDQIGFYYNDNYDGMQHAWFKENILSITQGDSAEVTLLSTSVRNNGTPGIGVAGAEVKVNGTTVGITDASGKMIIPTETIGDPGQYTLMAQKIENGKNILTYTYSLLIVKKKEDLPPVEDGKITVKFRLIGDAKHTNGTDGHGTYVTWIATKKMTFTGKSVTVRDVFMKALDNAGLDYSITSKDNYVNKIKAPKAYGGYWLEEKDNGSNSGWMYTLNGVHPNVGLKECPVNNGDSIIWHYVDDYIEETYFDGNTPKYPNRWLEAEDVDPPTDGSVIDMSKGNGGSAIQEKDKTTTAQVSTEAKVDSNGKATAAIGKNDIAEAIKKVKESASATEKANGDEVVKRIVLEVKGTEKANILETIILKESMTELYNNVDIVTLKTAIGEVRFDKESFATIAENMDGDVKLIIARKSAAEIGNVSEQNMKKLENRTILEFKAEAGSKNISQFGGDVSISIPYEKPSNEQEEALIMYWIKENGELQPIASSNFDNGYMIMKTNHWSTYVIGYNEAKFTDTASHWAKKNILYLAARDIIKGKSSDAFLPDSQITRAEFVQILANMSGDDLSKYTGSEFSDVSEKAWYAKAVAWAVEKGISGGTGNDKFSPNANITRQDMSVMISKYAANVSKKSIADTNKAVQFADGHEIASYAKEAVTAMQKAGIINGAKNNLGSYSFNPKNNATRAEATTMIANYMKE